MMTRKRSFTIPVRGATRKSKQIERCNCNTKTKRFDEKSRDYVVRKGTKK